VFGCMFNSFGSTRMSHAWMHIYLLKLCAIGAMIGGVFLDVT